MTDQSLMASHLPVIVSIETLRPLFEMTQQRCTEWIAAAHCRQYKLLSDLQKSAHTSDYFIINKI